MIKELDNSIESVSSKIREVFQASYSIEAQLLQAVDFPPLKRTLDNFLESSTQFFGFWEKNELSAIIEIKEEELATHIQSLVVHPNHFRLGIGQKLLSFVFLNHENSMFTIETGVDNGPAISLYEKNEFVEVKQWNTEFGIRKARFERAIL
jgi:ribosomal protein S18 acetylase RimI-like enzyme